VLVIERCFVAGCNVQGPQPALYRDDKCKTLRWICDEHYVARENVARELPMAIQELLALALLHPNVVPVLPRNAIRYEPLSQLQVRVVLAELRVTQLRELEAQLKGDQNALPLF
jgi:hypothetical protein